LLDKFFNFIFSIPLIRKFKPFYEKRKDIVLYIFFGGLTTVVSLVTFWLFVDIIPLPLLIANTVSWVVAVSFAFFTNRIWVFNSPTKGVKSFLYQMGLFFGGRLFSLAVETAIIFIFAKQLGINAMLIKLLAQIGVLILNYIISKVFIFKKKPQED